MCFKRNQHEKQMFEDFWIDKVDMVTFQAFQPPNFEEDFTDFYPDMDSSHFIESKPEYRCPQPFHRVVIRNILLHLVVLLAVMNYLWDILKMAYTKLGMAR